MSILQARTAAWSKLAIHFCQQSALNMERNRRRTSDSAQVRQEHQRQHWATRVRTSLALQENITPIPCGVQLVSTINLALSHLEL